MNRKTAFILYALLLPSLLCACAKDLSGWQEGRYHLAKDGTHETGWFTEDERTYYLNPAENGAIAAGWMEIDGSRYHFSADGILETGWIEDQGAHFFLGADGTMQTGWIGQQYLGADGRMVTGWQTVDGMDRFFDADGMLCTGWTQTPEGRRLLDENGCICTGWVNTADGRVFLTPDGSPYQGWLEEDGVRYYFREDGTPARGQAEIDGTTYFFTSTGANILLVNNWNPVPEGYTVDLVPSGYGCMVDRSCQPALKEMLNACKADGNSPSVISGYRSYWDQDAILKEKAAKVGYAKALTFVALPGTSEHHLGLAVDVIDSFGDINSTQHIVSPTQVWLAEHCWDYGFILRYPESKGDYTGIMYETWHFRYVGTELALELRDSGMCLEEYLDSLSPDMPSCGGIGR